MPPKAQDEKQNIDIAVLQEKMDTTEGFIEDMKTNHLPHIYNRLNSIDTKQAYYAGGLAVFLILVQLVFKYLLT